MKRKGHLIFMARISGRLGVLWCSGAGEGVLCPKVQGEFSLYCSHLFIHPF